MTDRYNVGYSVDALGDLREIYSYIANELLVPEAAAAQLGRIRKEVRSLDFMPARYTLVEWEPWHSMQMHQLPVNNLMTDLSSRARRTPFGICSPQARSMTRTGWLSAL